MRADSRISSQTSEDYQRQKTFFRAPEQWRARGGAPEHTKPPNRSEDLRETSGLRAELSFLQRAHVN